MDIMLERILELIGTKHGSAQELVRALGLSKNTVTEWKSGRKTSYTKHAPQIAEYYGVSLDWLSGLSDDKGIKKEAPSEDEAKDDVRIQIEKKLNAADKDQLLKWLAMMELMEK